MSISEIVDTLIKEGLVVETGKMAIPSGRPSTLLDINVKAGKAIALAVKEKGCLLAASDLKGKILRLERFARGESTEELKENLKSSLERILKSNSVVIYGAAVASDEEMDLKDVFPFPYITLSQIEAQTIAEKKACDDPLDDMLFIMANDHISSFYEGRNIEDFAHIRVAGSNDCYCGLKGCIDTFFSGDAFKRKLRANLSAREILAKEDEWHTIRDALPMLADAVAAAANATGAKRAMIVGDYADMKDECYAALNSMIIDRMPSFKNDFALFKSVAGDSGVIEGACFKALDHFFYRTELLRQLKKIESC